MKRFYPDYASIHAFTLTLDFHRSELECIHCLKSDQLISHGNICKQRSQSWAEKVGKRLFCSNRNGRSGCGRTFQLYAATEIPACRYNIAHLCLFIIALKANKTIHDAYHHATGQLECRHAWRWLKRLMIKISDYRCVLRCRSSGLLNTTPLFKSLYLQHLLPTLTRLLSSSNNGFTDYQMRQQQAFF